MTSLFFYGGVGEVGGNKILLKDKDLHLFLDFGTPFSRRSQFFEEYLNPRPGWGLLDFLEMDLLPPLRGIYRKDLEPQHLWSRFESHPLFKDMEIQAVLLSHAHLDHSGYISFLKEDIPIYTTAMTAFVCKAIQDSGKTDIEREVCYTVSRGERGELIEAVRWTEPAKQRSFKILNGVNLSSQAINFWGEKPGSRPLSPTPLQFDNKLGASRFHSFPIDHSIPGACALAVETSTGWIVYTGDIRFHGKEGYLSQQFVTEAARLRPYALISEGTYMDRQVSIPEVEVLEKALKAVKRSQDLVIADFAPRDVERLLTFHKVAEESHRLLVILPKDAYLLEVIHLLSPQTPDIALDPIIRIYYEPKLKPDKWEEEVLQKYKNKLVSAAQIHQEQMAYILCFSFLDINELISIKPDKGGLYIYSSSEPHDEEGWLDLERLHNWLKHFNIRGLGLPRGKNGNIPEEEQGLHASGHASGVEILRMIQEIKPHIFIPIHTKKENYQYFEQALANTDIKLIIPELGKEIRL
jgi:ribonuclease J